MGGGKDLWWIEYEQLGEDVAAGKVTEDEHRARLKALGFDPWEIEEHIADCREDQQ